MNKLIKFLEEKFAPKMNKLAENAWIQVVSSGIMLVLPIILLGSVISLYNIVKIYVPVLPDVQPVYSFSFGLYSLILSFLIGYQGMDKLHHKKYQLCCGIMSLTSFMMMLSPTIADGTISFEFSRLGPKGILVSFVAGLISTVIMHLYANWDPFKNNTSLPEFIVNWLNQIFPTMAMLTLTMICTTYLNLDIFVIVQKIFEPITVFGQTLPGFLLICLTPAILYSLGISSWLLSPVYTPIMLAGITANIEAVAAGLPPTNIVTQETIFIGFVWIGGMGATLPLVLLMLKAKSKKLRTMGKVCLVPSLFNINEPVIFGTPVAFNPFLMVPMWINAIVGPLIVWFTMKAGLVNVPAKLLTGLKVPMPISSVIATDDMRAVVLWAILLAVYTLVWYPFFKSYDKDLVEKEK